MNISLNRHALGALLILKGRESQSFISLLTRYNHPYGARYIRVVSEAPSAISHQHSRRSEDNLSCPQHTKSMQREYCCPRFEIHPHSRIKHDSTHISLIHLPLSKHQAPSPSLTQLTNLNPLAGAPTIATSQILHTVPLYLA